MNPDLENTLNHILAQYHISFNDKEYSEENEENDLLMNIFSLTPTIKRENRQYWGRELGMCWQIIITKIFQQTRQDYQLYVLEMRNQQIQ